MSLKIYHAITLDQYSNFAILCIQGRIINQMVYMERIPVQLLPKARKYLESISGKDKVKIYAGITGMQYGDFSSVTIKTLRGSIRELIEKFHRLLFFTHAGTIYFVSGFRKKSRKTPKKELDYAEQVYKLVKEEVQE